MLPVPRFTPTVRKFRPKPIDLMQGLKKVKVCLRRLGCSCMLVLLGPASQALQLLRP